MYSAEDLQNMPTTAEAGVFTVLIQQIKIAGLHRRVLNLH